MADQLATMSYPDFLIEVANFSAFPDNYSFQEMQDITREYKRRFGKLSESMICSIKRYNTRD